MVWSGAVLAVDLDGEPDLEVVAEAADGAEAVEIAAGGGVDLVILDIAMPRMTGLQAAREMSRRELPAKFYCCPCTTTSNMSSRQ